MKDLTETHAESILSLACWIWPESMHWDLHNCYSLFRHAFTLEEVPDEAPLYVTADQSYQLYVNGQYVCRGPARGFQSSWPYDQLDVRPYLNRGNNVIAVRAHNPGFSNFQYITQSFAGLLLAAQWGQTRIMTDTSWKCRRQGGVRRDTVPTSLQLFCQEAIDLRLEPPGWASVDFEEDESWNAKVYSRPWNAIPWTRLESRGIPMLDESIINPKQILGQAQGENALDYLTAHNLAILRGNEGLGHDTASGDPLQIEFPARSKGVWQSVLIDFGKVVVGSLCLEIEGAQGGEIVDTFHAESIDDETLAPHFLPETHCRMAFAQRIVCRQGKQDHAFYHTFGFRYLVLTVRDNLQAIHIRPTLRQTLYPHEIKGSFRSSDDRLNRIWDCCAWTQRICSMDAYVDTPWREQAQWWGDARVQAWNTFHLSGDDRLFKRGIGQIANQVSALGLTYGHAPTMAHDCVLPDFSLIWMLTLWDDYWQTGSLKMFESYEPVVLRGLKYFEEMTDDQTGLLAADARTWMFLDWSTVRQSGYPTVYSLWYLYTLDKVGQMYQVIGENSKAGTCREKAAALRRGLLPLLNEDGLLREGYDPDRQMDDAVSVHAQTLAIMTGLEPENDRQMLEQSLLPAVLGGGDGAQPSAYWITYVFSLLVEHGYGAEVIADIRQRWAVMADFGSAFERFTYEPGKGSRSHAWSAHPLYHLMQIVGGIHQREAGWKAIDFFPYFVGNEADVSIPSPRGIIKSQWKKLSDRIQGSLELPAGVSARLRLPGRAEEIISSGKYEYHLEPTI